MGRRKLTVAFSRVQRHMPQAAADLMRVHGGKTIYIPTVACHGEPLHKVVGIHAYVALTKLCGGRLLKVPLPKRKARLEVKHAALTMVYNGATRSQTAAHLGVTRQTVSRWAKPYGL